MKFDNTCNNSASLHDTKDITHCSSYVKLEYEIVNFAPCDKEIIITMRLLD